MPLIFAAALCSVFVSILLKFAKKHGYDVLQMIAWNYAIASVMCFVWFKPDLAHISIADTPWWLIAVLGMVLPSIFLALAKSLQTAGILKTEIAQRLSVVLSLLAAYFLFQEQFSQLKIIGIILGIVAVLCILFAHSGQERVATRKGSLFLLSVWVGYALVDILLKYTTNLGLQFAVSLNLSFIFAFVISILFLIMSKTVWQVKNLYAGLFLGLLNFANIALYVKAHLLLKDSPAVVFAGMNILVVLFGVVAGLFIFKEKLKISTILGLLLGLAGVLCLSMVI
ncbi:EamA family transporter [Acinetobacter gerneri]|uniref:EamA family transporter n=1 Tax=Acinetobacter gerneri TaxID=202952 RepID=A0AAW8JFU4_9GAMM|nr:EamA family transporter [Acinetobacter gerneri]MDQ9008230.1 EamA family transporter [Acinetobacter gerneri]MDQ9012356.1 EamA family transporter [Acinetobacter gerneri]MDQ9023769.1 EamA family transporter [Acinetobacter gerneri]MDQ9051269.1 EamA family transporter [Acinetobacter gerneri]MDQ9058872.1 EamA family transporter [Acinetobacter gerneri]